MVHVCGIVVTGGGSDNGKCMHGYCPFTLMHPHTLTSSPTYMNDIKGSTANVYPFVIASDAAFAEIAIEIDIVWAHVCRHGDVEPARERECRGRILKFL